MIFIRSSYSLIENWIPFYNWWNRNLLEFPKKNSANSSNHGETIPFHEACREYVWFRSMSHHTQEASEIITKKEPTKVFDVNSALFLNSEKVILRAT